MNVCYLFMCMRVYAVQVYGMPIAAKFHNGSTARIKRLVDQQQQQQ